MKGYRGSFQRVSRRKPKGTVPGRYGLGGQPRKGQPGSFQRVPRTPLRPGQLAGARPVGTARPQAPAAAVPPRRLFDDAQSSAARAAARFRVNQGVAELDQQSAYEKTDFTEALRRMAVQRPKDEQQTREGANSQGLFYSGQLGKRLGEVATSYTEREGDARQGFDRSEAARVAARRALEAGLPIEEAAISAELAERQVERDSGAADVGGLVPNDLPVKGRPAKVKAVPRKSRRKPKFKGKRRGRG